MEVEIGSLEGATKDSYLPMNSLYNYSYTQQIYTAGEIGMAGTINAITVWMYGNENLYEMPFDIYMIETSKNEFTSTTDWIPVTAGDIVYSGTVTVHNTEAQAYTFTLNKPFTYSGTGNLVICFNNTTGSWVSGLNGMVFGTDTDPKRALYARQDGGAYDPTSPTFSAYGQKYVRNVIVLDITTGGNSILVNDGTDTNDFVPIYGYYCDYSLVSSQFIIPASDLAAMQYGTINNLIFYTSQSDIDWGIAEFEVYMTEVPGTTFSSATLLDWSGMEKVMNAGTLAVSGNEMVVTLDAPYQYLGGNLLIGFKQTVKGSEGKSSWYGVSTGESVTPAIGGASSISARHFKPKTTISYTPGTAPSVLKPTNLAVNYTGGKTAEVSWTSTEPAFDIDVNGTVTQNVTTPYTLTGLALATTYNVKVRAKNTNGVSDWTNPVSFKTDGCENPTIVNYNLADSYGDGWSGNYIVVSDGDGNMVDYVTIENGSSASGTLRLCGDYLEFAWYAGNYSSECSWTFTDVNGNELFSGQGDSSMKTGDVLYIIDNGACPRPTDLAVSEIGPRSAKLSWKQNGTADKWKICFVDSEDNITRVVIADSNPFTLTGLTPETAYTIRIIAVNGTDESLLSQKISFTTATATPIPTDLALSNVSPTNATVSWSSFSSSNELRYVANPNYANQGYVTNPGAMDNGADASWLQGSQTTWGAGANYSGGALVADDFTIYSATTLKGIEVYAYQTGSTTSSTFTGLYVEIYDGNPADGANLVWGDISNNIMSSTSFTNCYRGSDGATTETTRPIMAITASGLNINLAPGTYWLVYGLTGSGSSGPWAVPYSMPSVGNTGEGLQYSSSTWAPLNDSGSDTPYGCAMKLTFNEDIESLAWTTINDINANEYNLTGLDPETFYLVQVRSNYGSDGVSNWTTLTFNTPSLNPTPTNVEADLMANSADLTWTGNGESYNVRYRMAENPGTPLFFEDFESGLDQWTVLQGDGSQIVSGQSDCWFVYDPTEGLDFEAHGGSHVASSWSWYSTAYQANNYLITPQVTFGNMLKFWVRTNSTYPDQYEVLLSTGGNAIENFRDEATDAITGVELQAMAKAPTNGWSEVTIDLSAYAGQKGYIAIHHNDYDANYLLIDNFGIYNATPAGSWTTASTNDATFTLSGLATNTAYDYQIQSVRDGSTSAWTDIQSFALLTLPSDADNTNLVVNNAGRQAYVTFTGNTLYKDATYNTMCLPVDLNVEDVPFADATIKILNNSASSYDSETKTLTLTFKALTGNVIPAGTPFLVKWATGSNITDPYFVNGIVGMAKTEAFIGGKFTGNIRPVTLSGKNMYFGSDKPLMWPNANASVNAFKACVIPANDDVARIIIDFGDGTELSVTTVKGDANGDNNVSITDAVAVVNFILGNPSGGFNKATANVNGDVDGEGNPVISITDAVGVVNIILNGGSGAPSMSLETNEVTETNESTEEPE